MSIFDIDENVDVKIDRDVNIKRTFEQCMLTCVMPGTVKCIVAAPGFADRLLKALETASLGLAPHRDRKVISNDCRGLKKGDALGWIRDISNDDKDAIVVLENVTQIPEGDPALYDPKPYVENILVRSLKNTDVYIDDYHIDRRNLTVVLTCPPEDEEHLRAICSMCSYAWVGDIENRMYN